MWDVFVLFLVPIGGGIPAGVILAQKSGLTWPMTAALYAISDIALACVFEPLMIYFVHKSKTVPKLETVREAFTKTTNQILSRYSVHPGPFALVLITFGTDPMTGRAVSKAVGHGFITGWALVIAGDMIFFGVLMASTLWLNNILGDGTWAAIIITGLLFVVPGLIKYFRERRVSNP